MSREEEEKLENLSFLGKGVQLRQQFFEELVLNGVAGSISAAGLSCIGLRDPVDGADGPMSKMYSVLHGLCQKGVPIPGVVVCCSVCVGVCVCWSVRIGVCVMGCVCWACVL